MKPAERLKVIEINTITARTMGGTIVSKTIGPEDYEWLFATVKRLTEALEFCRTKLADPGLDIHGDMWDEIIKALEEK